MTALRSQAKRSVERGNSVKAGERQLEQLRQGAQLFGRQISVFSLKVLHHRDQHPEVAFIAGDNLIDQLVCHFYPFRLNRLNRNLFPALPELLRNLPHHGQPDAQLVGKIRILVGRVYGLADNKVDVVRIQY